MEVPGTALWTVRLGRGKLNQYRFVSDLPQDPAVYALCSGPGGANIIYVGRTEKLKTRIAQHLIARDSSINTFTAAARLNADRISEVRWWTSAEFVQNGKASVLHLQAAELVAFEILDPILRSNAKSERQARTLAAKPAFKQEMTTLFKSKPTGRLPRYDADFVLAEIWKIQDRLTAIETELVEMNLRNAPVASVQTSTRKSKTMEK
jgi:hypothetical protein